MRPYCVGVNDYHIHLHDHGESGPYTQELIDRYVFSGEERGVTELGFTEHIFRFREANELLGEWWSEDPDPKMRAYCERYIAEHSTQSLDEYIDALTVAKSRGLPVKIGLEIDYYPGRMSEIDGFLADYPLDFRLGSVHWIGAWGFDDPGVGDEWEVREIESVWTRYFDLLADLIATNSIDALAHPDLVKKFGYRLAQEPVELYRRVATMAAERSIAFEVSSAGLRKPVGEAYPSSLFLEVIRSAGASITTASDAHGPQEVGVDFDRLSEMAITAGFTEVVSFTMRDSRSVRLR